MIAYFCTTGTYFGDSLNPANCVLEVTNPFDITTYNVYYDILEYVEKHKDQCNFEIRGISTATYNSIFSLIVNKVPFITVFLHLLLCLLYQDIRISK